MNADSPCCLLLHKPDDLFCADSHRAPLEGCARFDSPAREWWDSHVLCKIYLESWHWTYPIGLPIAFASVQLICAILFNQYLQSDLGFREYGVSYLGFRRAHIMIFLSSSAFLCFHFDFIFSGFGSLEKWAFLSVWNATSRKKRNLGDA